MGNHLLVRIHPEDEYSDDETRRRYKFYFSDDIKRLLGDGQIIYFREKWENLSEFELFHAFIFCQLPFYILPNLFLIDAYGTHTVSFGPKVPTPVPFLEFQVLIENLDSAFVLQKSDYLGYCKFRWN